MRDVQPSAPRSLPRAQRLQSTERSSSRTARRERDGQAVNNLSTSKMDDIQLVITRTKQRCKEKGGFTVSDKLAAFVSRTVIYENLTKFQLDKELTEEAIEELVQINTAVSRGDCIQGVGVPGYVLARLLPLPPTPHPPPPHPPPSPSLPSLLPPPSPASCSFRNRERPTLTPCNSVS